VLCLQLLLAARGLALDPAKDITQYNCQTWSRQNGLMVNVVNAIAQTEDGYLWLGTSAGLLRFDGTEFTPIQSGQRDTSVVASLASARNGGLWVGMENNAVGFCDEHGLFVKSNVPPVRPVLRNYALAADADGSLWIVADHLLARLATNGTLEQVTASPDEQATNIICGFKGSQGRFWYGTSEKGVYYWQAGKIQKLEAPELDGVAVSVMTEDHAGNLWVGTTAGLWCYDAALQPKNIPRLAHDIRALLVDREGVLWIGCDYGLVRYYQGKYDFFRHTDGLPSDFVTSIVEDREGSLWIGTRNGLCQLTDVKFPNHLFSDGSSQLEALSVFAARQGGIWIGSSGGLVYLNDNFTNYGVEAGLPNLYVKRVYEASNGKLYLVCGAKDLAVFSGGKVIADYIAADMVVGMAEDAKGVVVSVGRSLYRVNEKGLVPYAFTNDNAPSLYWVLNLAPGRDGVIWVACVNGIARIKDGTFQQWTTADGLTDARVNWICEDSDGIVWGAMSTGIVRLKDNHIRCISEANGLFANDIFAIIPDDLGNLWVDSGRGIYRVSRQSLNDFADGKSPRVICKPFDGLESVKPTDKSFQERVGCKSVDGRIWFPGANSVVAINPHKVPTNQVVPPVHIQSVRANGRAYPLAARLVVPPGNGELELHYTALSFIAPLKIRFQYQLEGYEQKWVKAESRHLAFYTNLKPGIYTFHVIAANSDGVWNMKGDSIVIELRPHFYQTAWFYTLCAAGLFAGLAGGYMARVRHLTRKELQLKKSRDWLESEVNQRTAELAYERDLLRELLDNAPDQIYFKDLQSRFIRHSKAQAKKFGLKDMDSVVGKTDFDFFAEEHARPAFEDEQQIIRTGQALTGQVEKEVWNDGRETWVLTNKMPLRDRSGKIIGTFGISKDITVIKQAEVALAYERDLLHTLLENSPDHIYFKDAQSRFIKSSSAQARQFGLSSAELLVGKSDFDFFTEEHARPAFEEEQEIIRTGQPMIGKIEKESWKDGRKESWVLTTKMPLRNKAGDIIGTFGISKDITAIKEAEAKLKEVHQQLLETSRQAGMAEVATNVLHNVGNVLNSVNVSASVVLENSRNSKIPSLAKVVALLDEHAADLGSFIATDAKGRQVPAYLRQLAGQLAREQEQAIKELELLRQNIEHIKDIVAMQQSYAKISGVSETVRVVDLVEDALGMNAGALTRHEVELIREYTGVPPVTVEKHKVLQILVNLIRNAKYACDESGRKDKKLRLRISQTERKVMIGVIDNGIGIPPENLTRIFNHGFTTRKNGHGFGLHSGALAAEELGGALTVHSDGPGLGATFSLELPLPPVSKT